MSLTAEQHERLTDMLQALRRELDNMGEWAKGFVSDMCERHDKYGPNTYVSTKQWVKLREIYDKFIGDEEPEPNDEIPF